MNNFITVIYDTETTGIGSDADVVELASVVVMPDGGMLSSQEYCRPLVPMSLEAYRTHGIGEDRLVNCRSSTEVVREWFEEIRNLVETTGLIPIFAGYNTHFDRRICRQHGEFPAGPSLCGLRLARHNDPDLPDHKLETVYSNLISGAGFNAHNALDDCWATLQVLQHYSERLGKSFLTLAEEQNQPKLLTKMPFGKHKGKQMALLPPSYMEFMLELPELDQDVAFTFRTILRS